MRAEIHQVVTFATEPFRGNPAFVVSLERDVPDRLLQQVAAQLKEDVLASLRPVGKDRARLLFHTAAGPHGGAGHAMLAAAHVQLRGDAGARQSAVFELADASACTVTGEGTRIATPWPVMPALAVDMADTLSDALGGAVTRTLVAPFGYAAIFDDPDSVAALRPDMDTLARLDRGAVIATAPGDTL